MRRVDEIVAALQTLSPRELDLVRKFLNRLEQRAWRKELSASTADMKRRGITDRQIDAAVMRRRRARRRQDN